jgi:hypothetical protein
MPVVSELKRLNDLLQTTVSAVRVRAYGALTNTKVLST